MRNCLLVVSILAAGSVPANASSFLFTSNGAGTVAITVGSGVSGLSANNDDVIAASASSVGIAFGNTSGADFQMTGPSSPGNWVGAIDFSDTVGTSTGGSCLGNTSDICKVDSDSSIGGSTTINGATADNAAVATAADNQWNALISNSTGWSSVPGTNAVLSGTSAMTLCVGSGLTGCTATAATTTTLTIGGVQQTAYVFNILTTGNSGHIGAAITINGNNTGALVVLNYVGNQNGNQVLQSGSAVTLAGGLTSDQVLLNVESEGLQTSGGFVFNGAIAIQGSTANLDNADINGRLYIDTSGSGQTDSIQSGFDLTAPANVPAAPEPGTMVLMGGALIALSLFAKKRATAQPVRR